MLTVNTLTFDKTEPKKATRAHEPSAKELQQHSTADRKNEQTTRKTNWQRPRHLCKQHGSLNTCTPKNELTACAAGLPARLVQGAINGDLAVYIIDIRYFLGFRTLS